MEYRQPLVFHLNHTANSITYQLQIFDGEFTKCVKVELKQDGDDITGQVLYAKYVSYADLGADFDDYGDDNDIAASESEEGYGVAMTYIYTTAHISEEWLPDDYTLLWENVSLQDIAAIHGVAAGGNIGGRYAFATPYFYQNNGTAATVQLQVYNGGYTKCIKVELRQNGSDIEGSALYRKYHYTSESNVVGTNFDSGDFGTMHSAEEFTSGGYGMTQLRLVTNADASTLKLTTANSYTGDTLAGGGTIELAAPGGTLGNSDYSGNISTIGNIFHSGNVSQRYSGNISGPGALIQGIADLPDTAISETAYVQTTHTVYFSNANLADYNRAAGTLCGNWIPNQQNVESHYYTYNGTTATFQLQAIDGEFTKCVIVELTQSGPDIAARVVDGRYKSGLYVGTDFNSNGSDQITMIATADNSDGYGAKNITLGTSRGPTLILSGTSTYIGGTIVKAGNMIVNGSRYSLPNSGNISINHGATLYMAVTGLIPDNDVGESNPVFINGGNLYLTKPFNFGTRQPITVDGGTLFTYTLEYDDSGTYLNDLTLLNDANINGAPIRVGNHLTPFLRVEGTSPSWLNAGISMVNGGAPMNINVADTTGDATPDLHIGQIRDYPERGGLGTVKNGPGTISLNGINTHEGSYAINEGAILLNNDAALNSNTPIVLNGGSLLIGSVNNTTDTLTLTGNSKLDLGSGKLAFADSSEVEWTEGATLTLTGTLQPESLRFGTTKTALTKAQKKSIFYEGKTIELNSNGYVTTHKGGTTILVQ